jgi:tRNA-specific 2-thiouridylase
VSKVRAISLFSGGLDSICATRLVMEQDIEVIAVKFVTPFFGYEILGDPDNYRLETKEKYGIDVRIVDISDEYLQLLRQPSHGFGKYFNPCIDCKIFMLSRARTMLKELKCSFLITGEVLGQRPMSQRRDTLNVIERDSGNRTILLRPLSAKLMNETEAEREGLIDREKLLDFSGRGRSRQIALAKSYEIVDYPAPAGGCILADPILSRRISYIYSGKFVVNQASMNVTDILLLLVGRQFILPGGGWLILGRDEKENLKIDDLREDGDIRLDIEERPGPIALLRRAKEIYPTNDARDADVSLAAGLVVRYAKKVNNEVCGGTVIVEEDENHHEIAVEPAQDDDFSDWLM